MNLLQEIKTPIILGHRGASAFAPENTLSAFKLAVEQGADGIELDVKLTKDKYPIVIHDKTVDRTTDGSGKVSELTLRELKTLDAGGWFSNDFQGERLALLSDVFEALNKDVLINIELTNYDTPLDGLVRRVINTIKHHSNKDQILISSFSARNLKAVRTVMENIPIALLVSPSLFGLIKRSMFFKHFNPKIIHPHKSMVRQSYIQKQHSLGRRVHVWTVNKNKEIKELIENGVDGIITDDPKLARTILDSPNLA